MDALTLTAEERVRAAGYDDIALFENYSYDDALIGITEDGRAVYDYDKMVDWLIKVMGFTLSDATEYVDCNTIRQLPFLGPDAPLIMYRINNEGTTQ